MRRAADLVARLQALQPNDRNLGQHFLVEEAHLEAIVKLAGDLSGRTVLEIGPGPGTLTEHLLRAGAVVHAIEIDPVAVEHLQANFAPELSNGSLTLDEGDALTAAWPERIDAVVSNIPYQISSPLIGALEQHRQRHGAPDVVVVPRPGGIRRAVDHRHTGRPRKPRRVHRAWLVQQHGTGAFHRAPSGLRPR